jgi:undecaprenyl diphosphate synthase
MLDSEVDELHRRGVRVAFIGDRSAFPEAIRERMDRSEQLVLPETQLTLTIAAGYGGRWDIAQACRQLASDVAAGRLRPEDIDEARLQSRLGLAGLPEPDLFIRTGGDVRISNFLLWQVAYTELWFTETLWPDLDDSVLLSALADFGARERRFGLTSAQVSGSLA